MNLKPDYIDFKNEIGSRGITQLVHFTSTENLINIYKEGRILSRQKLEAAELTYQDTLDALDYHDDIRYDDKRYINLSVQHPNSFLFEVFKTKKRGIPYINWCVLLLDTDIILRSETLFSVTNAANARNKPYINGAISTFRNMFAPTLLVQTSRNEKVFTRNGLKDCYPTDAQAEVLAKDKIDVGLIKNVCFRNIEDLNSCKAAFKLMRFPSDNFIVDDSLFIPYCS